MSRESIINEKTCEVIQAPLAIAVIQSGMHVQTIKYAFKEQSCQFKKLSKVEKRSQCLFLAGAASRPDLTANLLNCFSRRLPVGSLGLCLISHLRCVLMSLQPIEIILQLFSTIQKLTFRHPRIFFRAILFPFDKELALSVATDLMINDYL